MNIQTYSKIEGAIEAEGLVVLIDILRACTTINILFARGVNKIIPVLDPEDALLYKNKNYILIGEGDGGVDNSIFDFNNSPSEVINKNFINRNVVLRSNNATKGILSAKKAKSMVLGSFLNLQSLADYIKANSSHNIITMVPLGRKGKKGLEDELFAQALTATLKNETVDYDVIDKKLRSCACAKLVSDDLGRPEDVDIALRHNAFPNIPEVDLADSLKTIRVEKK